MGCGKSREFALQELNDVFEILKVENEQLQTEKETLMREQIDKPSDEKEIIRSISNMTAELELNYRDAQTLLVDFVESINYQKKSSPETRIGQIIQVRLKLEDTYRRIENCYSQKQTYSKLNSEVRIAVEQTENDLKAKRAEIQKYRDLFSQLNL
jgi:predicted RNase H-like HicB family nuclease